MAITKTTITIVADQVTPIIAAMGQGWADTELPTILRPLTTRQRAAFMRSLVRQCQTMLAIRAQPVARGTHLTVVK